MASGFIRVLAIAAIVAVGQGLNVSSSASLRSTSNFGRFRRALLSTPLAKLKNVNLPADLVYNTDVNFHNPKVWGPPTWFFLHSMTLALPDQVPEEQQKEMLMLLVSLEHTLPCSTCGQNLAKHMKQYPVEPHLASREEMVDWMIKIHNEVNKDTGKPVISRDEALSKYTVAFDKKSENFGHENILHKDEKGNYTPKSSASPLFVLATMVSTVAIHLILA